MAFDVGANRRDCAIVADELGLVRAGVIAVLESCDVDVVAQTRSGRELVSLATVDRLDLVVVGAPADLDVADVVRRLVRLRPHPAIVVLLPPAQDHVVRYLIGLGAGGVALRSIEPEDLAEMVEGVLKGGRLVAPGLQGALTGAFSLPALSDRTNDVLSSREREVLVLLAEGRTNRDIANALSVTLATVKSHLVRVYAKLEARNRNEAVARAVSLGLLT